MKTYVSAMEKSGREEVHLIKISVLACTQQADRLYFPSTQNKYNTMLRYHWE